MTWRPIDFNGIVTLDRTLIDQMDQYLMEKETRLAHQILNSIYPSSEFQEKPTLPLSVGTHLKLSDAVEGLTKKIREMSAAQLSELINEQGDLSKKLNQVLWEFTEVLEGCIIELFQQIKLVPVDKWHISLEEVVLALKNTLMHYLDDMTWVIRRLEGLLKEYNKKLGLTGFKWRQWFVNQDVHLDPNLLVNLSQYEKYLKDQYEDFQVRYSEYRRLNGEVEAILEKMKNYPVLALLDMHDQNLYVDIFRLLKLREFNTHPKGLLAQDTVRSLKNLCGISSAIRIFKTYYHGLNDVFFNSSLELKSLQGEPEAIQERVNKLGHKLKNYENELHTLLQTISQYREFIVMTDPNPYIRSKWGFTEKPVAPEPPYSKSLLKIIYNGEELLRWFNHLLVSLEVTNQNSKEQKAKEEIDRLLHEMSQPLISHSLMHSRCEKLLENMRECDEMSSRHLEIIHYMEDVFSKALRSDWKYHVLHEFTLFHELYRIHQGLQVRIDDPAHSFRIEHFDDLFNKIEYWVNKGDIYSHINEIELDMNDMKTYLQDFLATIQRADRDKSSNPFLDESIEKYRQQLLDYRYLFGQFFHTIVSNSSDGAQLRNQFLFVDQYFETIENLLNNLQDSWEGKETKWE